MAKPQVQGVIWFDRFGLVRCTDGNDQEVFRLAVHVPGSPKPYGFLWCDGRPVELKAASVWVGDGLENIRKQSSVPAEKTYPVEKPAIEYPELETEVPNKDKTPAPMEGIQVLEADGDE